MKLGDKTSINTDIHNNVNEITSQVVHTFVWAVINEKLFFPIRDSVRDSIGRSVRDSIRNKTRL